MKKHFLALFIIPFYLVACHTTKTAVSTAPIEKRELPEVEVVANPEKAEETETIDEPSRSVESKKPEDYHLPVYQESHTRGNDLIHTKLDLHFDWAKQWVLGKATLTFKPYFYPTDSLILDAKNFDIHNVTLEGGNKQLKYDYNGKVLTIHLDRTYTRTEEYKVFIDYTAKPNEGEVGGSDAITEDKGLYFINPTGEDPDKPQQIWTQGETESNSRWYPTIDKPNERATDEIYVTVADKFKTLSNGILMSSKKNADGTRTDYWKMDKPHAPYLVMLAIGDYAVVKDKWNGIDVDYYVEPKYEKYARNIFPYTTELLQFYSDKLGVTYPWQKFSQVIVRDYVSGAMENTTAVIFGDFMQASDRDLIDVETNELVVAHEMFHHWFGDYVTCESWSNLTLNEGFANYSEYLWTEHKHGKDAADHHLLSEQQGYIMSSHQRKHDLIDFRYDNREDMFDGHSYNKGGAVLHMLRTYVGDDAFFAALNRYLTKNAFTDVEAHELRLAFEDVTGEDLNWFFNQWFYSQGHPKLDINYAYDDNAKTVSVTVEQTQDPTDNPPIFILPIAIDIYQGKGAPKRQNVRITERKQTFTFPVSGKPDLVNVDADKALLAEKDDNKSDDEYVFQFYNAPNFRDRYEAIKGLNKSDKPEARKMLKDALNDKFWGIRQMAVEALDAKKDGVLPQIAALVEKDPRSEVRSAALEKLAETKDKAYIPVYKKVIEQEQAYPVISAALKSLHELSPEEGLAYASKLETVDNGSILNAVATIYLESKDTSHLAFFEKAMPNVGGYDLISFMSSYALLGMQASDAASSKILNQFKSIVSNTKTESIIRKIGAFAGLMNMRREYRNRGEAGQKTADEIVAFLKDVANKETSDQIKGIYMQMMLMP